MNREGHQGYQQNYQQGHQQQGPQQGYEGQGYEGQGYEGQGYGGRQHTGQQAHPGQQYAGRQQAGQQHTGQQYTGQQHTGQQYPYPEQQQYAQPYAQQQQPQQYAAYPEPQQYQQPQPQQYQQAQYLQPYAQDQYTQQWEGQTWETQVQPPIAAVDVTETAYLPAQTPQSQPQPQAHAPQPQPQPQPQHHTPQHHAPQRQATQPHPQATQEPAAATPAPAPADHGPSYGPATTTGNTRVTDAQRARAEGRSPVIEPGMQPAALTALLGLLLAGGAAAGQYALLVPLVILQAVTAAGWFRLNGMWPARQGIALAFLGGVVADAVLLTVGEGHGPAAILGTLGVWVLLVLVLQLRSRAGADERMYGLMATVVSAALAIIAAGHLAAVPDAVTVGGVAVAVAVLARALPLPTPASVVVALLAATGGGVAVGGMTDLGGGDAALLALGAGVCALIGHRVASYDYPSRFVHMTAGVALPLAAAAPAVYLFGRAFG
ncbi:hypothetical protein DCW30_21930 [Streptomyces alfalfae]|uniref:Membrane protein YfcA n=1 Tax=Streptomyces alfalfae TaxID=1642299 RepID=A0ABM6H4B6_9ACTN|nr:hypothetical protein [Streptomyces alfalfae]APY90946.1 hypothetical protein A7J05_19180 [Streptomyces alfalfae]AYA21229.1 hypothetical protein D3X13_18580 [Streptomyces fradiae]RXX40289.1 hypothetical protein DCW30_21930 [Streptomyces alfalfae]RZM96707.1 hypothetical protein D4104_14575 [Streptomyces alfalfae]